LLDSIPYAALIPASVLLGLAPFYPRPHLVEKLEMLVRGQLRRPLDVFDLLFHAFPLILLVAKWLASRR